MTSKSLMQFTAWNQRYSGPHKKIYRFSTCILALIASTFWMLPLGWNRVLCDSTEHLLPAAFVCLPSFWTGFLLTTASLLSLHFFRQDPGSFLDWCFSTLCELLKDMASSGSNQLPLKTSYLIQCAVVKFNDFLVHPVMEKDYVLLCHKMLNPMLWKDSGDTAVFIAVSSH